MEQKMAEPAITMSQTHTPTLVGSGIDVVGILIGLFSVVIVIKALNKVGGQVGSAFKFTLLGVLTQMLALIYDLLTEEFAIIPTNHHLHDGLMVIGMIFFVLAAQQFSKLST